MMSTSPANSHSNHPNFSTLLQGRISQSHLSQIHALIFRLNLTHNNLIITRFIGHLTPLLALRVLHHLPNPNLFPFNAALRVLSQSPNPSLAFPVFSTLKLRELSPNDFTFSFLLKACLRGLNTPMLKQVHAHIAKSKFGLDPDVANGLLLAYAKGARDVVSARKVFDEMPEKGNASCWTFLIAGFAQLDRVEETLVLFLKMVDENVTPTDDTMVSVLSACSKVIEIDTWVAEFSRRHVGIDGFCRDCVETVLLYFYGKCGDVEGSRVLFEEVFERRKGRMMSVVTWNAMVNLYAQNVHPVEALDLFRRMVVIMNPKPNHVTMVGMLSACSQVGDLHLGRWAHNYIKSQGSRDVLASNKILATAFIDMYSKCGSLLEAEEVFQGIPKKDVVIFNAMIMGLAVNGKGQEAIRVFDEMKRVSVRPSGGTFLGLLSACAHSGLIDEGCNFFKDMEQLYSIKPEVEHYSCYADLLARKGRIKEAFEVVGKMPVDPNEQVWGALLGACLIHSKADMAVGVAEKLVDLDPQNSVGYVMLSNAYATDLRWEEIDELRGMMRKKGVRKQPGCSWISIGGLTHGFYVSHSSHPEMQRIYYVLDSLYREMLLKLE